MSYGFNNDKSKAAMIKGTYTGVNTEGVAHSVPNNTITNLNAIRLPGIGTYIVTARLRFTGRSGGTRRMYLTPNPDPQTWQNQCEGTGTDYVTTTIIHKCTTPWVDDVIHINAYQNSGATLTVYVSDVKYVRLYED